MTSSTSAATPSRDASASSWAAGASQELTVYRATSDAATPSRWRPGAAGTAAAYLSTAGGESLPTTTFSSQPSTSSEPADHEGSRGGRDAPLPPDRTTGLAAGRTRRPGPSARPRLRRPLLAKGGRAALSRLP